MHHLPSVVGVVVHTLVAVTATIANNVVVYTVASDTHIRNKTHIHI